MAETQFTQFFVKLLDNKSITLRFPNHQTLTPLSIKREIQTLTNIPIESQTLTLNGKLISNSTQITPKSLFFTTLNLNFSLLGGKGGFGSLLRGAATKAGQKKTNNFDACRDMSGRRLRHVNAEKKLEEWKAEEEERKLEKMAEDYLKKMEKKGKGGKKDEGAEKYVEKYREESRKCVEEVERSVRESFGGKKRKVLEKLKQNDDAKKLKIWMGKRKIGESDSDDSDTESDDSDEENEKSVVTENGNQSDSSKDNSSASVSIGPLNEDGHSGPSSNNESEEEKEVVAKETPEIDANPIGSQGQINVDSLMDIPTEEKIVIEQDHDETKLATDVSEINGASECKLMSIDDGVTGSSNSSEVLMPLNFDDFNSAAELEVLGMERLKTELQTRGLKCGGTLQERSARLFLLKTTPLDKLPKKLLAKK